MNDTSGQKCSGSSASAALQSSLENKLRPRLDGRGSPLYALTWKHWDMLSGPPICALRGSGRRTLGNDCGGWPTPIVNDELGSTHCYSGKNPDGTYKIALKLPGAALTVEGWATPQASDNVEGRRTDLDSPQKCLGRDVKLIPGETPNGSPAPTGKRGQLNPAFSLWLMGFPSVWGCYAPSKARK